MDLREDEEVAAVEYKNTLFAHAFMNGGKELFMKLYPEEFGDESAAPDWSVPKTAEELQAMMAEFR